MCGVVPMPSFCKKTRTTMLVICRPLQYTPWLKDIELSGNAELSVTLYPAPHVLSKTIRMGRDIAACPRGIVNGFDSLLRTGGRSK